jgi:hypothetical protein
MNRGNVIGAAVGGTVGAVLGWKVGGSLSSRRERERRTVVEGTDRLVLPFLPVPGESYIEPLHSADGSQQYLLVLHNTTPV